MRKYMQSWTNMLSEKLKTGHGVLIRRDASSSYGKSGKQEKTQEFWDFWFPPLSPLPPSPSLSLSLSLSLSPSPSQLSAEIFNAALLTSQVH